MKLGVNVDVGFNRRAALIAGGVNETRRGVRCLYFTNLTPVSGLSSGAYLVLVFYFHPLATYFRRPCVPPVVGLPHIVVGRETCFPQGLRRHAGDLERYRKPVVTPRRALNEISSRYFSGDDILFCNLAEYACRLTKVRSRTSLFSSSLPSS